MKSIEVKTFDSPDETRTFDKGKVELIVIDGRTVGRATLQPGWRWSESVRPLVRRRAARPLTSSITFRAPST